MNMFGYETKTTFWDELFIAELLGDPVLEETCKSMFKSCCDDTERLTELVLVLNWKTWEHYEAGNKHLASVYNGLYLEVHDWALDNLKGDALTYYLRTTD